MATAKTSLLEDLTATPSDEVTRMVYADALDVAGHSARAAFVRSGEVVDGLLDTSELAWRRTVSPAAIQYCSREDCPRHWNTLAAGDDARRCGTCARSVAYGGSLATITAAARERLPLVVDPAIASVDADACYRRELGLSSTRVSELPIFGGGAEPADVPELEIALGIRMPADTARPPRLHRLLNHPSELVHAIALHVHRPVSSDDVYRLHCYRVVFATDRVDAEARLAARFGAAVVEGEHHRYGHFTVAPDVDFRWSLSWMSASEPTSTARASELPLFAWSDVPVRVGELEAALHMQVADSTRQQLRQRVVSVHAPHITNLRIEARAPLDVPNARDLLLGSVRLVFASDREACEARLRERYGEPVVVRRGHESLDMYGPFFFASEGAGFRIEWFGRRPTWAYALADRRDAFIASMVEHIAGAVTLDEIWQLRPPDGSGCSVGWTDNGNVIVAFRPAIRAADLAAAFGWPEVIAPREPGGFVLHVPSGNSVVLPACGRFAVHAHLDGTPRGAPYRDLETIRQLAPSDMVKLVIVTSP